MNSEAHALAADVYSDIEGHGDICNLLIAKGGNEYEALG